MSLMRRFFLNDGLVHVGAGRDTPSLCGVTISKYRRSTDADITCETCLSMGPAYGVNVGRLNVEGKASKLALATAPKEPDIVDVDLRCVCGHYQARKLDGDAPVRATLAGLSCESCGRLGRMYLCSAPPASQEREIPPHPEEP